MECRPLAIARTPYRRFPQETPPRDDIIFPVSSERPCLDLQFPSYNNLENDRSGRLSDVSDIDYRMSFESSERSLEANSPGRFFPVSGGYDGISSSSNSLTMVMSRLIIKGSGYCCCKLPHVFCLTLRCNFLNSRMMRSQKCRD